MRPICKVWKMFFMQAYSGHNTATCALQDAGFCG